MKQIIISLLFLFLVGCATHPLGMSDDEWTVLSPEQQFEASKEQARLDNERRLKQMENELRREELRLKGEQLQLEADIANGMIAQRKDICIGGPKCPGDEGNLYILSIGDFAYVDKITFHADDRIGRRHRAKVDVYADRTRIAKDIDIKKAGATHEVFVGTVARNIVFKAIEDDEVRFHTIKVFGRKLGDPETKITIIE